MLVWQKITQKIDKELSWSLFVNEHKVEPANCIALKDFPRTLDAENLRQLLTKLDGLCYLLF